MLENQHIMVFQQEIFQKIADIVKPPPRRAAWQWAKEHRVLDYGAEPGKYRPERTPWIIPITDAIADCKYDEIVCPMGSQLSKTEGIILNVIGWKLHDNPDSILLFEPTEIAAETISKGRLNSMLFSVPKLKSGIDKKRFTVYEKYVNGVRLGLVWSSPMQVAMNSAPIVCVDEADRMENIKGEGDPYELLKVRGSTYSNFTMIATSSPTEGHVTDEVDEETGLIHWVFSDDVDSKIWQLWQTGTRHEYMLPCLSCGIYFSPKMKLLIFDLYQQDKNIEKNARLKCPHCSNEHDKSQVFTMVSRGKMIAPGQRVEGDRVVGDPPDVSTYSAWVSGLCSPWRSIGKRAVALAKALRSGIPSKTQAVINTNFGELYKVISKAPDLEFLNKFVESYPMGTVPNRVVVITCAVDVQIDRLIVVTIGWSADEYQLDPWIINYEELPGITSESEVWTALEKKYLYNNSIVLTAVDSGFNPSVKENRDDDNRNIVYQFVRKNRQRCVATKGSSNRRMISPFHVRLIDKNRQGKTIKWGLSLWEINTDYYKRDVYSRMKLGEDSPGRFHFPNNLPDNFFRELVSEERIDGRWVARGKNHVLDCVVLNFFLANKENLLEQKKFTTEKQSQNPKKATISEKPPDW